MVFPSEIVEVVTFVFLLGLASEIILYLWCYSTPSFRTINASITRQSRKLERTSTFSAQPKSKKAERLEKGMKQEATKELAVLKVKQTIVVNTLKLVKHPFANSITPAALDDKYCRCSQLWEQSACSSS